jgi:cell division inhibitor SepF
MFKKLGDKISNQMIAPGADERYYEEEYYYEEDYDDYDDTEPAQKSSARKSKNSSASLRNYSRNTGAKDNIYGFTPSSSSGIQKPPSESVIKHPKTMDDAVEIGSHVRSGRMCIVELTGVADKEAQRIADYLCGLCDGIDGSITRVNGSVITVAPPSHRVMPDYSDESLFEAGFLKKTSAAR